MQKNHLFKQVAFLALILSAASSCFAASEVGTTSSDFLSSSKKSYEELYSESSYYEQYNLVTDTRVRYYQPLHLSETLGLDAYAGANLQYQSSGAKQKYFDNAVTPYVGIQGNLFKRIFLQLQAGVRTVINDKRESNTTQWDPRVILSAGDFWHWPTQQVFTEAYGEVAYVPRLDATPVSTGWIKQGYRFKPTASVNLDPYAEFYSRESRSPDLGPSMTEARFGLRSQWLRGSWNVAALVYHPVNRKVTQGDVEGLLVVGGVF
ncbi:hypothetical protein [Bdellovibrio svalbardensis]|uniref:Uncharacterized protein n=1 Tax=Bdellovibrio svalbardensis TaxID=2972972 RepID=A0ABT6DKH3_9BACT|nr:hypothetical protein [Bdellovibrio svalbardensis]MDG0817372.1 hypothetical protein [Bdellovibrio svalbardensis]